MNSHPVSRLIFTLLEFWGAYVAAFVGVKANKTAQSAIARKACLKARDCMVTPLKQANNVR
jgi:hypothetical protein